MKISLASDHSGFTLKKEICAFLKKKEVIVHDHGVSKFENVDYSDYVPFIVNDILVQGYDFGLLICSSGMGMSIMANRYAHIRAGLCCNVERAIFARQHNNINVLCIGADFTTPEEAKKMVNAFISTSFSGEERHIRRLSKFDHLGENNKKNVF